MSNSDPTLVRAVPERVDLSNFAEERAAGEAWLAAGAASGRTVLTLDLAPVTAASSLLVALLVAWLRRARAVGVQLKCTAVPATVQAIIEFSGLEEVLPTAAAPQQR